ncbi:MAG: GNAT family N-acetyltransferase [Chitinophagaceae bacterium]|nr:GNAT family N-acetyltransferase [Chitinophagaceae bacterium]
MEIVYKVNRMPATEQVIELYKDAGLPRPVDDPARISKMFANANLVVTAWDGDTLVGVSRCITDFSWCCYLSDLAIRKDYQRHGIGKKLIRLSKEHAGEHSMVLLLSVPDAMEYYPKAGMEKLNNAFWIQREK